MTQSPSAPNEEGFLISQTLSTQPMLTIVITPENTESLQEKQSKIASNAFLAIEGISSLLNGTVAALIKTDVEAVAEEAKEGSELLQKQLPVLIEEGEAAVTFLEHFSYANTTLIVGGEILAGEDPSKAVFDAAAGVAGEKLAEFILADIGAPAIVVGVGAAFIGVITVLVARSLYDTITEYLKSNNTATEVGTDQITQVLHEFLNGIQSL